MPSNQTNAVGKLESVTRFTVHTFNAVTTVRGRKQSDGKPRISGLYDFSRRYEVIYRAAASGDPFASYQLVQLEDQIKETELLLEQQQLEIDSILAQLPPGLKHDQPQSVEPETFKLYLSHYASMVLRLVATLDQVVLGWRNLMHQNLITGKHGMDSINALSAKMRFLMSFGAQYRYTGIKQQDLIERNALAVAAMDKLYQSQFINKNLFPDPIDAMRYYSQYEELPEYGPVNLLKPQDVAAEDSDQRPDEKADKPPKSDKASKRPFKGKREMGVADESTEPLESVEANIEETE